MEKWKDNGAGGWGIVKRMAEGLPKGFRLSEKISEEVGVIIEKPREG